jgi:hypothetical protein
MYEWLKQNDYKGIIIYDDIYLKKGHAVDGFDTTTNDMVEFWNKIPNEYKIDLTHVGHWSGTGLVSFNLHYYFKASHNSTSPLEKS